MKSLLIFAALIAALVQTSRSAPEEEFELTIRTEKATFTKTFDIGQAAIDSNQEKEAAKC
mgnify:CR=1 FL=1|jgi:hypothetical protein